MHVSRNPRIGSYYSIASVLTLLLAGTTWPLGGVLVWPGVTLACAAAGYFWLGPRIYVKREGRLSAVSRVFMAPVIAGQHLSLLHYARQCDPWNEVTPRVWIGRKLTDDEARAAVDKGVTAVLDLTIEFSEATPFLELDYLNLPILDLTAPSRDQLAQAARFIRQGADSGIVYIHCKVGYSRSAAAVGAYLLREGFARDMHEVVEILERARAGIVVRPEIREALRRFEVDPAP